MLKVGIVGLRRGETYFLLNSMPNIRVTAICDIDRDQLDFCGKRYDIPDRFTRYGEMLKSDLDIVIVATPPHLHVKQSVQALEAGINVLSEVPAAITMEECHRLAEAVEDSEMNYMMAENYCYIKENVLLKELISAGRFGELYFGEGEYVHDCKFLLYNQDGSPTWRGQWLLNRNGNVYPTHSLGPLYQMFRERIVNVCCLGSGVHTIPNSELEDCVLTLCKTESGKLLKLRLDVISNRPHNLTYYALQGTRGCYEAPRGLGDDHKVWFADDCGGSLEWKPLKDYEEQFLPKRWKHPPEEAVKAGHWGSDYFMMLDFVESILQKRKPPIDVYDALNMTAPGILSEESIRCGGVPVKVPDFRKH